jgi:hypothetical protein
MCQMSPVGNLDACWLLNATVPAPSSILCAFHACCYRILQLKMHYLRFDPF